MFLFHFLIIMSHSNKDSIEKLRNLINHTETIIIGAGSGLSTSAGYEYEGDRYDQHFSDFREKYGITDMYSGGFYNFKTSEEFWAFMSRQIYLNRYSNPVKPVYDNLYKLVKDKNYFVITTNVDHCFQKAGFDKKRLFYTQGDFGLFQCSHPCTQKTWDNEETIIKMKDYQKDMKIPSNLIPRCPICGREMTTNLRIDEKFVQDEGWHEASKRYDNFLKSSENLPVVYLELGVGFSTPGIIKFPFWRRTLANPKAKYATINFDYAITTNEIKDRSICIDGDIGDVIKQLL